MPDELEYIVDKAVCHCDKGATPNFFKGLANQNVKINGCMACTKADKIPIANIPSFGVCSVTGSACAPAPVDWTDTYKVKIKGKETLLFKSKLPCSIGGKIEFMTSGQIPVSEEDLAKMTDEHSEKEEEDEGWGWWDTAELIPVVGSVIGIVRSAAKGNWWMVAANVGFLALDIAGVVSFGATTAASTAAKGGLKAGLKVAGKAALEAAGKVLTKEGAKALAKGVAKHVDDIAKATMKVCVFACFIKGTKIAIENGYKNIEDIQIGDFVWAYNEETRENELREVLNTMENDVDATIVLTFETENIETTAEHPFYTQKGWKEAADLTQNDKILARSGNWVTLISSDFLYEKKKVYNFEVDDLHTYFVSEMNFLVHNTGKCVSKMAAEAAENIAKTWDDLAKFVHCFTAETLVKIENGYAPIETLAVGDFVLAFDAEKNENILKKILKVYQSHTEKICCLYIEDEVLECTSSHRFWSLTHNDWIIAGEITEGCILRDANGGGKLVNAIKHVDISVPTFNLEVKDAHTYYVSPLDILVHNGNPFPNSSYNDLSPRPTKIYGIVDKSTNKIVYVGKSVQKEGTRLSQHVLEKKLDPKRYRIKVLDKGNWNAFQTAAREQHYIMKNGTKLQKLGAQIKNKINALSRKKFDYFSKIIKCP
ncbi:polymorphic toxin-type HINT domain-containing protein [Pedobacter sp. 22226]|uniref:polymorphic toxin-type HINT domain-containing protein n=1 Tax=Pedobacter sp. 22226 TaxID=3453894 RepID=UPI003F84FB41